MSGGRAPLKYQWQVKIPGGDWVDIPGETADTLILKAVTLDMNGNQHRAIVTDASGSTVTSRAAALTIKAIPHTGDNAPVVWWSLGIVAALACMAYVVMKRKKEEKD